MRIGILETGEVSEEFRPRHGSYPDMFEALFAQVAPDLAFFTVSIVQGEFPAAPEDAEGWLVTGSRHGVYDPLPWIAPLGAFLRDCLEARVPVAGICFGHQILAQALGGEAGKAERGWGIGVHDYELLHRPEWLAQVPKRFAMQAMHQDQVTRLPDGAQVLARSDFCPIAAAVYGPMEAPDAISVQPHPEFDAAYSGALVEARAGTIFPEDLSAVARSELDRPLDSLAWAQAIAAFFRSAVLRRTASAGPAYGQNGTGFPR